MTKEGTNAAKVMNQLYRNRRKFKLVWGRTQNTNLKLNNTKQKMKPANSRGAREKSLYKPELVEQSTLNKSKLNKTKKTKRV